jgi:hypothetical protein
VEIGPSGEGPGPAIRHLVFDPEGVLLGSVFLPPVDVMEIGSSHLLGVYTDEFEVEYLGAYEINKPGG